MAAIMPDQHNFSFANVDMRAILDGATILECETAADNAKIISFLRKRLRNIIQQSEWYQGQSGFLENAERVMRAKVLGRIRLDQARFIQSKIL